MGRTGYNVDWKGGGLPSFLSRGVERGEERGIQYPTLTYSQSPERLVVVPLGHGTTEKCKAINIHRAKKNGSPLRLYSTSIFFSQRVPSFFNIVIH